MKSDSIEVFSEFLQLNLLSHEEKISVLERHKLGGLFKEVYPEAYKKYWVINTNHLNFVQNELSPLGLKGVLLKGCHLIQFLYKDSGQRFMGDVDILVSPEDLSLWVSKLEEMGFQIEKEERWKANDFKRVMSRVKGGMELVVELHSRLFFQESSNLQWETEPLQTGNISVLKKEDLFVHLCGHLVYQHTFHSLNWLYDILLLIESCEIHWNEAFHKAKKAKVEKSCRIALVVLNQYFGSSHYSGTFWERFLVRFLITPQFLMEPYRNKLQYALVKSLMKDSWGDSLSYTFGWLKTFLKFKKSADIS